LGHGYAAAEITCEACGHAYTDIQPVFALYPPCPVCGARVGVAAMPYYTERRPYEYVDGPWLTGNFELGLYLAAQVNTGK
jgi:hypothetical protein